MCEHLPGTLHQSAQQFAFLWRQLNVLSAQLDDAPHQADRKIADAENRPFALNLQLMAAPAMAVGIVIAMLKTDITALPGMSCCRRSHLARHFAISYSKLSSARGKAPGEIVQEIDFTLQAN